MDDLSLAVSDLLDLKSLDWSPETESVMKVFHRVCRKTRSEYPVYDDATRNEIRNKSATIIYRKEKQFVEEILASADPFTSFQNYEWRRLLERSVQRDIDVVTSLVRLPAKPRLLAVGSGPIPTTSLFYEKALGAVVDNVDISKEALELSKRLRDALKMSKESRYILGDGATVQLPRDEYDIVHVSSMAGLTQDKKQEIISNVAQAMKKDGVLLMQDDGEPGGRYVFPAVEPKLIQGLTLVSSTPTVANILTTHYFRK